MTASDPFEISRVDRLSCTFEPRPWGFARERAADIDAHWADLTTANPRLYNGRVLLQHHGRVESDGACLVYRAAYLETEYKAFLAWRDFGHPDASVRNCFAMAALSSADGAFIVGEMAAHTANAGRVYFPAGTPDPKDVRDGSVDLEASALRELAEETGLAEAGVTVDPSWTLLTQAHRVACMKPIRSPEPAAALAARIRHFLAAEPEPELARVHVIFGAADCRGLDMPAFMIAYLKAAFAGVHCG
jgi:8-oxo-dGTP pyrophosphatase MutT (NUDIX family)